MRCPYCDQDDTRVIDSRPADDNRTIRRRRECLSCQNRFTTYEVVESVPLVVIKKDNSRQVFDRSKLLAGIMKSCYKCNVTPEEIDRLVAEIETELQNSLHREVSSRHIGVLVMEKLKKLNDVAYVRYASIYREFKDLDTFLAELRELKNKNP
jgi:transcriptional repressor NrdR